MKNINYLAAKFLKLAEQEAPPERIYESPNFKFRGRSFWDKYFGEPHKEYAPILEEEVTPENLENLLGKPLSIWAMDMDYIGEKRGVDGGIIYYWALANDKDTKPDYFEKIIITEIDSAKAILQSNINYFARKDNISVEEVEKEFITSKVKIKFYEVILEWWRKHRLPQLLEKQQERGFPNGKYQLSIIYPNYSGFETSIIISEYIIVNPSTTKEDLIKNCLREIGYKRKEYFDELSGVNVQAILKMNNFEISFDCLIDTKGQAYIDSDNFTMHKIP